MNLPTFQRLLTIQHIVPEELENTAQIGDKVTSLCGDFTYRLRRKDDPNLLVCGMCALLMVREYRGLLKEFNLNASLLQRLDEFLAAKDNADAEPDDEYVPDDPDEAEEPPDARPAGVWMDLEDSEPPTAPRGLEDVPLPGEGPGEQEEGEAGRVD